MKIDILKTQYPNITALNNRYLLKYAIFGQILTPKRGFRPKLKIGQVMIDIRYDKNIS